MQSETVCAAPGVERGDGLILSAMDYFAVDRYQAQVDPVLLDPLRLADRSPLASGRERLVFRHPHVRGVAVKVIRAELREAKWGGVAPWHRRRSRLRHYTLFMRELREYLALRVRIPAGDLPVARVIGLVETDLGLGLLTELLERDGGGIAPTLRELIDTSGPTGELHLAVEEFGRTLLSAGVVVNDINDTNLVARQGPAGKLQLVLVDGFGDKNLIPLLSMSRTLNRRNTRRRLAALKASLFGA